MTISLTHPQDDLPPPPPAPSDAVPVKAGSDKGSPSKASHMKDHDKPSKSKRIPAARPGLAKRGSRINLVTNHYRVDVKSTKDYFYHYSVLRKKK